MGFIKRFVRFITPSQKEIAKKLVGKRKIIKDPWANKYTCRMCDSNFYSNKYMNYCENCNKKRKGRKR